MSTLVPVSQVMSITGPYNLTAKVLKATGKHLYYVEVYNDDRADEPAYLYSRRFPTPSEAIRYAEFSVGLSLVA